jgi:hypothetical protein
MKNKLFRVVAILLMLTYFLPIASHVLREYLFLKAGVFLIMWAVLIILFDYNRLFSKPYMLLYFYAIAYFILAGVIWWGELDEGIIDSIIYNLMALFITVSVFDHFISNKDFKGLGILSTTVVIFISISCALDILMYLRTGISSRNVSVQYSRTGRSTAEAGWGLSYIGINFYYGICLLIPMLVACLKEKRKTWQNYLAVLIILLLVMVSLALAEYVTALLFGFLGMVLSLIRVRKIKSSLVILTIVMIIAVMLPRDTLGGIINRFADVAVGETTESRLEDLSITATYGIGSHYDSHINYRARRIPFLLGHFVRSPIVGGGPTTRHSFFLDRLSMFGIVGILPWILIIIYSFNAARKMISDDYRYYYTISTMFYLAMGIMKGVEGAHVIISLFLIAPGINFSVLSREIEKGKTYSSTSSSVKEPMNVETIQTAPSEI